MMDDPFFSAALALAAVLSIFILASTYAKLPMKTPDKEYLSELSEVVDNLTVAEESLRTYLRGLEKELPGLFPKKVAEMNLGEQLRFGRGLAEWNERLMQLGKLAGQAGLSPWPGPPPQQDVYKAKLEQLRKRVKNYEDTLESDFESCDTSLNPDRDRDTRAIGHKIDVIRQIQVWFDELEPSKPKEPKQ